MQARCTTRLRHDIPIILCMNFGNSSCSLGGHHNISNVVRDWAFQRNRTIGKQVFLSNGKLGMDPSEVTQSNCFKDGNCPLSLEHPTSTIALGAICTIDVSAIGVEPTNAPVVCHPLSNLYFCIPHASSSRPQASPLVVCDPCILCHSFHRQWMRKIDMSNESRGYCYLAMNLISHVIFRPVMGHEVTFCEF